MGKVKSRNRQLERGEKLSRQTSKSLRNISISPTRRPQIFSGFNPRSGVIFDCYMDCNVSDDDGNSKIRPVLGSDSLGSGFLQSVWQCDNRRDATASLISDAPPVTVKRTVTSTGARIVAQIKLEKPDKVEEAGFLHGLKTKIKAKEEPVMDVDRVSATEAGLNGDWVDRASAPASLKEIMKMSFVEFLQATDAQVEQKELEQSEEAQGHYGLKEEIKVKEEHDVGLAGSDSTMKRPPDGFLETSDDILRSKCAKAMIDEHHKGESQCHPEWKEKIQIKEELGGTLLGSDFAGPENSEMRDDNFAQSRKEEVASDGNNCNTDILPSHNPQKPLNVNKEATQCVPYSNPQKSFYMKEETTGETAVTSVLVEDGDFSEEPDWFLVGGTAIIGLSTTKGRKLVDNEIIHFSFPKTNLRNKCNSKWGAKAASFASSAIVRFSTERYGEIGRLPMEWTKCIIPLVNSSKVKVLGRCVAAPIILHLMQEIVLYVSFYIHQSVFTKGDKSSWRLDAAPNIDSTVHPLPTLFKLLNIKPFQEAEFTPEELDSRKRKLNLEGDTGEDRSMLPVVKRKIGCQQYPEKNNDEHALSESSLNKLVGAADQYNLEETEPPSTLMCDLRPYQKQALYWMSELEKGSDAEKETQSLHPCWAAYQICDERASAIYVNMFSGEASTQLPAAIHTARGGILADAMGLGKTVMTIALILARPSRWSSGIQKPLTEAADDTEHTEKNNYSHTMTSLEVEGGTLIVCPMALLSQWKDELETHSRPESLSIFIHYGGDRTNDPKVISEYDVVLTTYGVLTSAYKNDENSSIFHRVEWYRVVLDEAHTIKSSKTLSAQAAFALPSHCRWCLTGTPLQNNLEDLYSLLCFLHVEPWCNWAWWYKLIQKPYECGDQRGLKLIKSILRPLMLRRTKDTKDKDGRPIVVLPPIDIQVIECEQSEAEHDFYDALFKRSKVQFDQFVEQGRVLHNYASILELLLRLRQCCNHPFLVMSRGDTLQYADLSKLARKFLENNPCSENSDDSLPTWAFVEEVIGGIGRGENTECPICLESPDDPVLTPCAHLLCRECLLSSWKTHLIGLCPICRKLVRKTDLITCPSESPFRIDVEKNWKESSKISKLLDCLELISQSRSGEKSIVFSQWTKFLDLLEIPLRRRGIGFLRYDGKVVQKQRERILKGFSETKEKTVLLMSLKAGGVGLNLTAASNVYLMDPWWNPAVEEQAIMRIHRIGQKQTVRVTRFIVKGTVEERMQQVQARKQRMITGALTDEEVRTARIEELKMLFR